MSVSTDGPSLSPREYRDALSHYASGITIVSGLDGDRPVGFTCQSFHSVSLEPPLVCFVVGVGSSTFPKIRADGRFAVNVLGAQQQELAERFARSGSDKWAAVEWVPAHNGAPVIAGAHHWLAGVIRTEHPAGDHTIVVGSVEEVGPLAPADGDPLLFHRGRFRRLDERVHVREC